MATKAQVINLEKGVTDLHSISDLVSKIPPLSIKTITPFQAPGAGVAILVIYDEALRLLDTIPSDGSQSVLISSDIVLFFNTDVSLLTAADVSSMIEVWKNNIQLAWSGTITIVNNLVRITGMIGSGTGDSYSVILKAGSFGVSSSFTVDLANAVSWTT